MKYSVIINTGTCLLFLLLVKTSPGQEYNRISFGNLYTNRITVEDFKQQKQLRLPPGVITDSATIFLSIPGQPYITAVRYFPYFDSVSFTRCSNQLVPGAWVSFKIVVHDTLQKNYRTESLNYVFYALKRSVAAAPSDTYRQLKKWRELNYTAGTIYFSGENFRNVEIFVIGKNEIDILKGLFDRCSPGSTISFDHVQYLDDKNQLQQLHIIFKAN